VNTASVSGLSAVTGGQPIYTASKFAVVGLTRSVALEFAAKGIRVNAVCPAIIETEMTEGLRQNNEMRANLMARHPIGRFGQSEEIATAVLFLCSLGAAFITGTALPVDGGILA
jgi:NAD(P)-dependent dehydrogenase (short-subunit alcohol dehydrogenase family)